MTWGSLLFNFGIGCSIALVAASSGYNFARFQDAAEAVKTRPASFTRPADTEPVWSYQTKATPAAVPGWIVAETRCLKQETKGGAVTITLPVASAAGALTISCAP